MSIRISLSISLMLFALSILNAQQVQWLKGIHGENNEDGLGITVNATGYPICCGYFTSDTMFSGNLFLSKQSTGNDTYVIKYDLNGNPIWIDNPGGTVSQEAFGVETDQENNIYLIGSFLDTFYFGGSELQELNDTDAMLLKYDNAGNEVWGVDMNSSGKAEARLIAIDGQGNIIVGGRFYDYPLNIEDTSLINNGSVDVFLAKFNPDGELLWARSFGGTDKDFIMGLCVDDQNNVYFAGGFHSVLFSIGTYSFTNMTDDRAAVIVQLSPDGDVTWAENHAEGYDQQFMEIAVDSAYNLYCGGYFKGDFIFGSDILTNNASNFDVFLVKYNADHQHQWARDISSEVYERTDNLVLDKEGSIFIEVATFGDIQFGDTTVYNNGGRDLVIAKYDPDGECQWVIHGGGAEDDRSFGLAMGPFSNLYFTGYFMSDQLSLGQEQITNTGMMDAYIASLGPDCLLPNPHFSYEVNEFSVQFTASGVADSYFWEFGDGDTSTAINPVHTYASFGNYNVCLTVTNICGPNIYCEEVIICVDPIADFTYSTNNLKVSFYQLSQYADEYLWDFGDGNYSFEPEPVHIYENPENYIVCLTVFSDCGTDQHFDTVYLLPPMMCNFSFIFDNGMIYFTDESLNSTSCYWDFGDGTNSTEQNPVHQYEVYGLYNCCLTIENDDGIFTFCDSVFYCEEARAEFSFEMQQGLLTTTDLSSKTDTWLWDFGDGTTSIQPEPLHKYESSGEYTVCLTSSNPCSEDIFCKDILIEIPEKAFDLRFYPNPADDVLRVDIPEDGQYRISIFNYHGKPVYTNELFIPGRSIYELDVSTLPSGVYIFDLRSDNLSERKKIIICHL